MIFVLPQFSFVVKDGDRIAIKADNGLYWARKTKEPQKDVIEALSATITPNCRFVVKVLEKNKIQLTGDNGNFVSPINRRLYCHYNLNNPYTQFTISVLDTGKVAMSVIITEGSTPEFFLTRVAGDGTVKNPIDSTAAQISSSCLFTIEKL